MGLMGVKLPFTRFTTFISYRLRNQLIFAFSGIVLFIVLLLTLLSYTQMTRMIEQQFLLANKENIKLVNQNLDTYLKQIEELSVSPRKDEQFMNSLLSEEYLPQQYVQNQMKNLFYSRDDIEEVSLYTPNNHKQFIVSRSLINTIHSINPHIPKEAWYQEAIQSKSFSSLQSRYETRGKDSGALFFTFHRILINIADKRPLAALSITFNVSRLNKIIEGIPDQTKDSIGIFSMDNRPFYLKGEQWGQIDLAGMLQTFAAQPSMDSIEWKEANKGYFVIHNISPLTKWKLVRLTPTDVVNGRAQEAGLVNLVIGCGLLLIFILIVMLVSGIITRRLKRFSQTIDQLGEGQLRSIEQIDGQDEISHLSRKFNQMVGRINELILEKYEMKISERNAQLKALEAQINPHFLYNALQAISTKAILHGRNDIHDMVEALASTMRYCIQDGYQVSVADELEHVMYYTMLQKARFGSRLQVVCNLPDSLHSIRIPKMLLQMLVENSIKHGLEQSFHPVVISICGKVEYGNAVLSVSDNGPGITPERMKVIRAHIEDIGEPRFGEHIGLKNIVTRLKLMYGDQAQFSMESKPGEGVHVTITFKLGKEAAYVQGAHH